MLVLLLLVFVFFLSLFRIPFGDLSPGDECPSCFSYVCFIA